METYRPAVESRLQNSAEFRLAYPGLTPQDGLLQHQIHHFLEFSTENPAEEFAEPPSLSQVVELTAVGETAALSEAIRGAKAAMMASLFIFPPLTAICRMLGYHPKSIRRS